MSSARARPAALAGTWYPGEAGALAAEVDGFLREAKSEPGAGLLRGIVAPHAGYRYSGACAGYGYALTRGGPWTRVVILAPSHHEHFRGICVSDFGAYQTPLGTVTVDVAAGEKMSGSGLVRRLPEAEREEHAVEIQLPFLQRALGAFQLVPVLFGAVSEEDLTQVVEALAPLVEDRTLLVASSDLTHYGDSFGYRPFRRDVKQNLEALDGGALELIERRDVAGLVAYHHRTGITACGIWAILALMRLLPGTSRGRLLRYYTSGDLTGDWQHTVSYASVVFCDE